MALISQPGSDYQITSISLDAGYARDLVLMLTDIRAVLDHLYLDGAQPEITSPAADYLRESASPYSLPALIDALDEVTTQLSHAEREAFHGIPPDMPACDPADRDPAVPSQLTWHAYGPSELGCVSSTETARSPLSQ